MKKFKGFTLIELMVVISIIALLISILVPALGKIKDTANRMKSSTQIRGIHQGLVTFAQGNGAQEWYAGLDADGQLLSETNAADTDVPYVDGTGDNVRNVEARFAILLGNDFYSSDFLVSPSEQNAGISRYNTADAANATTSTTFTDANYSYALLHIPDPGSVNNRLSEWRSTTNSQAPIVTDRVIPRTAGTNITPGTTNTYSSLHSETSWRGNVAYNDNHVEFETTATLSGIKYANHTVENVNGDDLFNDEAAPDLGSNAVMIANGNAIGATNYQNTQETTAGP